MREDTITDALGHTIQEGDKVIYNLSGELALGIIKSARVTRKETISYAPYVQYDYLIEIEYIKSNSLYKRPKNGISKVRNPQSIVVSKGIKDGVSSIS